MKRPSALFMIAALRVVLLSGGASRSDTQLYGAGNDDR